MKRLLFLLLLILATTSYSQQPFRYDTIHVSKDDSRNIYQNKREASIEKQNIHLSRKYSRPSLCRGFNPRNLRYGLNLGLSFGGDYSLISFAPQMGYQFNKYFMAGAGISYYYVKRKVYNIDWKENYSESSLGVNLFGYFYPTNFFAISLRPEVHYVWSTFKDERDSYYKSSNIVPSLVVGAGVRLGGAHAMLYYDLVQNENSPYSSGIFYGVAIYF